MNSKPVFPSSCRFISAIKFNDSSALFCCHTIIISPIFADLALEAKLGNKANYILTDSLYVCIIYFFLLVFSSKWCFFLQPKAEEACRTSNTSVCNRALALHIQSAPWVCAPFNHDHTAGPCTWFSALLPPSWNSEYCWTKGFAIPFSMRLCKLYSQEGLLASRRKTLMYMLWHTQNNTTTIMKSS